MRLFVTGATGFVGRAVVAAATARGHEVLALCRPNGATAPPGCRSAVGSLDDPPWRAIEDFRPHAALHLAWTATPGVYLTSPENWTLVERSQSLFRGLVDHGVGHVAGVGTCLEYAPSNDPLDERRSPLGPLFPYSKAKAQLFEWLELEAAKIGATWTWFRLFYPYGVGEHGKRLPTDLIEHLRAGKTLFLKTPHSIKDYVYVADVAEAICRVLEAGMSGPVNLGTGRGVSIHDLAQTIARLVGRDPALVRHDERPTPDAMPVAVADVSRLGSLGWTPPTALDQGLGRLIGSLS
jgi:dTDP-6-deoxy-L-talose 4-dehydrogenase (NAD+)